MSLLSKSMIDIIGKQLVANLHTCVANEGAKFAIVRDEYANCNKQLPVKKWIELEVRLGSFKPPPKSNSTSGDANSASSNIGDGKNGDGGGVEERQQPNFKFDSHIGVEDFLSIVRKQDKFTGWLARSSKWFRVDDISFDATKLKDYEEHVSFVKKMSPEEVHELSSSSSSPSSTKSFLKTNLRRSFRQSVIQWIVPSQASFLHIGTGHNDEELSSPANNDASSMDIDHQHQSNNNNTNISEHQYYNLSGFQKIRNNPLLNYLEVVLVDKRLSSSQTTQSASLNGDPIITIIGNESFNIYTTLSTSTEGCNENMQQISFDNDGQFGAVCKQTLLEVTCASFAHQHLSSPNGNISANRRRMMDVIKTGFGDSGLFSLYDASKNNSDSYITKSLLNNLPPQIVWSGKFGPSGMYDIRMELSSEIPCVVHKGLWIANSFETKQSTAKRSAADIATSRWLGGRLLFRYGSKWTHKLNATPLSQVITAAPKTDGEEEEGGSVGRSDNDMDIDNSKVQRITSSVVVLDGMDELNTAINSNSGINAVHTAAAAAAPPVQKKGRVGRPRRNPKSSSAASIVQQVNANDEINMQYFKSISQLDSDIHKRNGTKNTDANSASTTRPQQSSGEELPEYATKHKGSNMTRIKIRKSWILGYESLCRTATKSASSNQNACCNHNGKSHDEICKRPCWRLDATMVWHAKTPIACEEMFAYCANASDFDSDTTSQNNDEWLQKMASSAHSLEIELECIDPVFYGFYMASKNQRRTNNGNDSDSQVGEDIVNNLLSTLINLVGIKDDSGHQKSQQSSLSSPSSTSPFLFTPTKILLCQDTSDVAELKNSAASN